MYMTWKGIGKIMFISVLRILLICKFLNFTKLFRVRKLISVEKIQLILPSINFEEQYYKFLGFTSYQ